MKTVSRSNSPISRAEPGATPAREATARPAHVLVVQPEGDVFYARPSAPAQAGTMNPARTDTPSGATPPQLLLRQYQATSPAKIRAGTKDAKDVFLRRAAEAYTPGSEAAHLALARRAFEEGRASGALELLEQIHAHPAQGSAADLALHARVASALTLLTRAQALYARAIELDPLNPSLRQELGQATQAVTARLLTLVRSTGSAPQSSDVARLVESATNLREQLDLAVRLAADPKTRAETTRARREGGVLLRAVNAVLAGPAQKVLPPVGHPRPISKEEALRRLSDPHAQPASHLVDGRRFQFLPPSGPSTLFRDGKRPHVRDDEQGKLGTCFLNSAWIACVKQRPDFVAALYRDLGPDPRQPGVHNYEVCVHIQAKRGYRTEPIWVAVDDRLVTDTHTGKPVFAQTLDSERGLVLDMALYEKAFAKANDYARILRYDTARCGFDSIDEGGLHEGFMAITGHIAATMDLAIGPEDVESGPKLRNHDVFGFVLDELGSGEIAAYTDMKPTDYLVKSASYDPVKKMIVVEGGSWIDLSKPGSDPQKLRDDGMFVLHTRYQPPLVLMDDHAYAILGRDAEGFVIVRNPHASNPTPDGPPAPGTFKLSPEDLRAVGHQASWCRFPKTDLPPAR